MSEPTPIEALAEGRCEVRPEPADHDAHGEDVGDYSMCVCGLPAHAPIPPAEQGENGEL